MHSGSSIARKFAQKYSVALLARKPANYDPVVQQIQSSGGHAIGISTDTSDAKSVNDMIETLKKEIGDGRLAAAVYNVGGGMVRKPFEELSDEEIESGWGSNG